MKKAILLCVLLTFSFQNIQATENNEFKDGIITGKVIDAKLSEPIPYVNVVIKNLKGEIITGGITKEDGTFRVNKIPEGDLTVTIQYIGYKSDIKNVTIGGETIV